MFQRSDEDLMTGVQEGDYEAFTLLFERYNSKILKFSYRFLNDYNGAADIVQETFIRIWDKASQYKRGLKFASWLYRIAMNLCLEVKRQGNLHTSLDEIGEEGFELKADTKKPDEVMVHDEGFELFVQALERLPSNQKIALLLAKDEGYSYIEIADIMQSTISSVESLIYRARKTLIQELKGKIEGIV
jgi:RNA polymerase sigma-70 factor, ECF subfamily